MPGYAGIIVLAGDSVLLIKEPDFFTNEPCWTLPSGGLEDGETPEAAAVREVAEESGCMIDEADLELIATAAVAQDGRQLSMSWNFTAVTTDLALSPVDPDEHVIDAQWFDRAEAIEHLSTLSYGPKREPARRFLRSGDRGLQWTFELIDSTSKIPSFRWDDPKPDLR